MSGFFEFPAIRHSTPMWGPPRVFVLSARDAEELEKHINFFLASDQYHVLAVSAAQPIATYVEEPWTATCVCQERTMPNEIEP